MLMNKGIILIATGNNYYGNMAYNLAITAKSFGLPVTLIANETAISHIRLKLEIFDKVIMVEDGAFSKAAEIRLSLPKYTPYEYTINIDVDAALGGRNLNEIFELLNDETPFIAACEGYYDLDSGQSKISDYMFTYDVSHVASAYDLKGKLYHFRGEFIAFKNTKEVKAMFKNALSIWRKPKVELWSFAGSTSEEIPLSIAANMAGIEPLHDMFEPLYWQVRTKAMPLTFPEVNKKYYGISLGGNQYYKDSFEKYKLFLQMAKQKTGIAPHTTAIQAKAVILPERRKH